MRVRALSVALIRTVRQVKGREQEVWLLSWHPKRRHYFFVGGHIQSKNGEDIRNEPWSARRLQRYLNLFLDSEWGRESGAVAVKREVVEELVEEVPVALKLPERMFTKSNGSRRLLSNIKDRLISMIEVKSFNDTPTDIGPSSDGENTLYSYNVGFVTLPQSWMRGINHAVSCGIIARKGEPAYLTWATMDEIKKCRTRPKSKRARRPISKDCLAILDSTMYASKEEPSALKDLTEPPPTKQDLAHEETTPTLARSAS